MAPVRPPRDPDAEEMVATLKGATALHLLRLRGRISARELATELGCHLSTAYDVLARLELSRRFAVYYERPFWYLADAEVADTAQFRARHENDALS